MNLEGFVVLLGLINVHAHLQFDLFPAIGYPPYTNYVEWTHDVRSRCREVIDQVLTVPLKTRLLWGAYKNILSGVTTVVHHDAYFRHFYANYPVEVFKEFQWIHSLALDRDLRKKLSKKSKKPVMIHLAEGTDTLASTEMTQLRDLGGLTDRTIVVHGFGLTQDDINLLKTNGRGLIWCPGSGAYLYGGISPIDNLRVALGTDSSISSGGTLLSEMRKARKLKRLSPEKLFAMVTSIPAAMLDMERGTVKPGAPADLLVYRADGSPLETLLNMAPGGFSALFRRGKIVAADPEFDRAEHLVRVSIEGREKLLPADFISMVKVVRNTYPAFSWRTLGVTQVEY